MNLRDRTEVKHFVEIARSYCSFLENLTGDKDVKPGLRAWDQFVDEYTSEIIWEWRETLFESHWGIHAVKALRVLHQLVFLRGLGVED